MVGLPRDTRRDSNRTTRPETEIGLTNSKALF